MNLEKAIKERIVADGRKQKWLAEQAGISNSHLSLFMNGKRQLSWGTITLIAKALDIPVSRLVKEAEQTDKGAK